MTTQKKVPVTKAGKYPLGHAKEAKDASAYTGFEYPSGGGNDIGVYKQPMMNPNNIGEAVVKNPKVNGPVTDVINISVGGISKGNYKSDNPYGVGEMRGYGAATKGRKISGKMG
jgi:hypothetical protein